ncbi:HAD family hydrolase [Shewanella cyperi]|nr:HAD family hydrolase [Shewanella cyperi]
MREASKMRFPELQSGFSLTDIDAVVFDLDGTLAHSNPDFAGLRAELGIPPGTDILAHLHSLQGQREFEAASAIVHRYEMDSSAKACWIDGARELVLHLQHQGLPLGILTRNIREAAQLTLSRLELSLEWVLTREDAPAKPDPAGLRHICQAWQLAPARVLYLGDYLFDVQTATNAGCRSGLYWPGEAPLPGYAAQADMLVPCYHGLKACWPR